MGVRRHGVRVTVLINVAPRKGRGKRLPRCAGAGPAPGQKESLGRVG